MKIKEFLIKLLNSGYELSRANKKNCFIAKSERSLNTHRIEYFIFEKPMDGRFFICSMKIRNKKLIEGRHILIDNFNLI